MKRAELKNDIKELLDREFSCRLVENNEEDIIRALNCIYSHYGYNYLHQGLYDLDYFSEVLENGRFVAAVAENEHDQVMGFGALDAHPWFPGLMEMGGLVANPLARGNGIGDMLDDYRIEIGRNKGIKGLFSTPVMPNPVSQKLLSRHGFIPTGMYFHAGGPASLGDSGDGIHPMDCGFSVYIYDKDTVHRIFAPEECKEFIENVYDEVGLKYEIPEINSKPASETKMFFNHEIKENLLEVKISDIGNDYTERIEELPLDMNDKEVEAIMLLMNMGDPMCPECYEYLRNRGFIFTGLIPGGDDELMIMEYLKYDIDKDAIAIRPDYKVIMDRVLKISGLE